MNLLASHGEKFEIVVIVSWLVVNPLVGYLIGQRKNAAEVGILLGLFLGPIGWLIAALYSGNLRKCPFCSEHIKPDAKVCRYCGRDLPEIPPTPDWRKIERPVTPQEQRHRDTSIIVVIGIVLAILLLLWWLIH